jgi:hypothetical protein
MGINGQSGSATGRAILNVLRGHCHKVSDVSVATGKTTHNTGE